MKLSKKSRYGIIALIHIASMEGQGAISLSNISQIYNLSLQYLEQTFGNLRKAGLVKSIKGPQGGYLLHGKPDNVTMAMIIKAIDGGYHVDAQPISLQDDNNAMTKAIENGLVMRINNSLDGLLENITLTELVELYESNRNKGQNMYYI